MFAIDLLAHSPFTGHLVTRDAPLVNLDALKRVQRPMCCSISHHGVLKNCAKFLALISRIHLGRGQCRYRVAHESNQHGSHASHSSHHGSRAYAQLVWANYRPHDHPTATGVGHGGGRHADNARSTLDCTFIMLLCGWLCVFLLSSSRPRKSSFQPPPHTTHITTAIYRCCG